MPEIPLPENTSSPIVALFGPTASGKSRLAIKVAQLSNAIIINADSMQIYRELAALTARPSIWEEKQADHRLYGFLGANDTCNAARWSQLARTEIRHAIHKKRPVLLVGGTGFYLKSLQEGLALIPEISPEIQKKIRALRLEELWEKLNACDPNLAQKLAPRDGQRLRRALEVYHQTGKPLSLWQQEAAYSPPLEMKTIKILPERNALYERCNKRLESIWHEAVREVKAYLALSPQQDWPLSKAIGVPQIKALLSGTISDQEAIEDTQRKTRNYAKRQLTWLHNQHKEAIVLTVSTCEDAEMKTHAAQIAKIISHMHT